jgi:diguanylate cyclase (GGDEF)-like protein
MSMQASNATDRPDPTGRVAPLFGFAVCGSAGFVVGFRLAAEPSGFGNGPARLALVLVVAGVLMTAAWVLVSRLRRAASDVALRDATSSLYNRVYMDEMVARLAARDDRAGRSQIALVMLRIDYLEQIGLRYGQSAADRVLGLVGRKIRSQAREGDIAARFDQQTLAVFLQCEEAEQAVAFGRRLATLLGAEQLDWRGDVIKVTASMGVAVRALGESVDALSGRAAARLAQASGSGSGRILF